MQANRARRLHAFAYMRNPYDLKTAMTIVGPAHFILAGQVSHAFFEDLPHVPVFQWPGDDPLPEEDVHWVSIAHLPRHMSVSYVPRIISQATPFATTYAVQVFSSNARPHGGYVLALVSYAHDVVSCLHERVLLEEREGWFANTPAQVVALSEYVNVLCPTMRNRLVTCEMLHMRDPAGG